MLKQVFVSSFAFFKDYRQKASEIIGLESGCCEGKRESAMNTSLVGELKSIGTSGLPEEREQFLLTLLKLVLLDFPELWD